MTKRVLVRIDDTTPAPGIGETEGAHYHWAIGERTGNGQEVLAPPQTFGNGELSELQQTLGEWEYELWLLVPGARVVTTELTVSRKEQRHLRSMAPFQLEDDLACEIDEVHFAFGPVSNGKVAIARVDKGWLQQHFTALAEMGLEIQRCLPEALLLPTEVNGWSVYLAEELQVCQGLGRGFVIDANLTAAALNTLLSQQSDEQGEKGDDDDGSELPSIALFADTEARLAQLETMLPEVLKDKVSQRAIRSPWQFDTSLRNVIDLCQGDFARQLPLVHWWQLWSKTAIFAAVVLVAFFSINFAEIQILKSEQQQLRKSMETAYRQVVPSGTLVDPEKQLQRRVRATQGGSQQSQLLPMLAAVTPLIASVEGVQLRTMNYSDDKNELRLNIQAPAFNTIEQLRRELNQAGLQATLVNASASGDVHQARLRILGR